MQVIWLFANEAKTTQGEPQMVTFVSASENPDPDKNMLNPPP